MPFRLFSKLNLNPFFAPEESVDKGQKNLTTDDIVRILGEDDEEEKIDLDKDKKEEKVKDKNKETDEEVKDEDKEKDEDSEEEKDEDDDDEDELSEIEDELEEVDEEDVVLDDPPRRKEILSKYPKIFKDFPSLEKSFFRERQFTNIFTNPSDAKEASEKATILDSFSADIMNGDTEKILKAAKTSPEAFAKLVDNYLPALGKIDKEAYQHVYGTIIKHTIIHMVDKARKSKDDDLLAVASALNKFVFDSDEFEPPKKLSSDEKKDDTVEKEKKEYLAQRFNDANSSLTEKVKSIFERTISANIDKNDKMSDYVKRNACRDAQENLENLLNKDVRLKGIIDKLWEKAIENGFKSEYTDKIKNAFVTRAKTLLPSVLKKARTDALKGMGKKVKEEVDDNDEVETDKTEKRNRSEKPSSNKNGPKKIDIPKGLSTAEAMDYLEGKV